MFSRLVSVLISIGLSFEAVAMADVSLSPKTWPQGEFDRLERMSGPSHWRSAKVKDLWQEQLSLSPCIREWTLSEREEMLWMPVWRPHLQVKETFKLTRLSCSKRVQCLFKFPCSNVINFYQSIFRKLNVKISQRSR